MAKTFGQKIIGTMKTLYWVAAAAAILSPVVSSFAGGFADVKNGVSTADKPVCASMAKQPWGSVWAPVGDGLCWTEGKLQGIHYAGQIAGILAYRPEKIGAMVGPEMTQPQ